MRFDIITLFPELFAPFLESGVTARLRFGQVACICGIRATGPRATTAVWMTAPSAAAPAW
jgi:tRNA G37 N-methylase TrmD